MASSYDSKFPPNTSINAGIAKFFEEFYRTSDTPSAHESYVDFFTPHAKLIVASKTCEGQDEILSLRKAMWNAVHSRHHQIAKIFPFGPDATEVMIYGTVDYQLKDGRKSTVPWGARGQLIKVSDAWKMSFYQVYLDNSPAMQNAK